MEGVACHAVDDPPPYAVPPPPPPDCLWLPYLVSLRHDWSPHYNFSGEHRLAVKSLCMITLALAVFFFKYGSVLDA